MTENASVLQNGLGQLSQTGHSRTTPSGSWPSRKSCERLGGPDDGQLVAGLQGAQQGDDGVLTGTRGDHGGVRAGIGMLGGEQFHFPASYGSGSSVIPCSAAASRMMSMAKVISSCSGS